jgi:proline dehydrogenase
MSLVDRSIAWTLPIVPRPFVRNVASRYIAGENREDALRIVARLNGEGFRTTVDLLGEDIHELSGSAATVAEYMALLTAIHEQKLDANLSIKLTQLGLKLDPKVCFERAEAIVRQAREFQNFVRIDMEDSTCTEETLQIFRELRRNYINVGVAIQAYLRRTLDDVTRLEAIKPNFRLCKGVYIERRRIAYRDMRVINRNYVHVLERLLRNGSYVGIATHDELIVWEAFRLLRELRVPPSAYEFEMLLGVEEELRDIIRKAGHNLRVYVPFGRDWYKYSVRRLRENPRLAGYVLRAMFKQRKAEARS